MISTIYNLVIRTGLFLSAAFFISFTSAWAISSVERNSFTNNLGINATDFHLVIAGTFTGDTAATGRPTSPEMPGVSAPTSSFKSSATADFMGGTIAPNAAMQVAYGATGANSNPRGYFTPTPNGMPPPNNQLLHSIYPNGTQVAFVPTPGGGFDTTLIVGNDTSFASLTGSLTVYVNNGFTFDVNSFDTLRNPQTLFFSSFSFGPNQAFAALTAHLTSEDQYILISGVANGDNSGNFPFSLALSPTTIPEPSSLLLFVSGLGIFLILTKGRRIKQNL